LVELAERAGAVRRLERADEGRLVELAVGVRRADFLAGGMASSDSSEGMNGAKLREQLVRLPVRIDGRPQGSEHVSRR
jgi:hypothetical protein